MEETPRAVTETQKIDARFLDLDVYSKASKTVRGAYKRYQIAELQLLAVSGPEDRRMLYALIAQKMRRYNTVKDIVARPETFELYILGRRWILGYFLRKDGFRYITKFNSWYFSPIKQD